MAVLLIRNHKMPRECSVRLRDIIRSRRSYLEYLEASHEIDDKIFDCLESLLIVTNHTDKCRIPGFSVDSSLKNALPDTLLANAALKIIIHGRRNFI